MQRDVIEQKIERREIWCYITTVAGRTLRWGYFWDEIPFMNLLWVQEELRGEDSAPGSWDSGKTRCEKRVTKRL